MISRCQTLTVFAIAAAVALAAACDSSSRTAVGPSPVKCQVSLSTSSDIVSPNGGAGTVDVSTNPECAWTASPTASWIANLTPASGQGNGQIQYRAAANPQITARQAQIEVNGNRVEVRQDATPCQFEVTPGTQTIDLAGGTGTVTVTTTTGCSWTAVSRDDWLTISAGQNNNRSGSITFRAESNRGSQRIGTLAVADKTVTVVQSGDEACVYQLDPSGQAVGSAESSANSFVVSTTAGCTWTAASREPWITLTTPPSGTGRGVVGFSVAANSGGARTGLIDVGNVSFTVAQSQSIGACGFALSAAAQTIGAGGGPGGPIVVSAQGGCSWSAVSNVPWITITSPAVGTGAGVVAFVVAANPGGGRAGTLTIANQTFTVTQDADANTCGFAIAPGSGTVGAAGGNGGPIAVSANVGCGWTAVSNAPWIAIASSASGSGNGSVSYTVAANPGGQRTGTITIATRTFTLVQDGAAGACSFAVSPTRDTIDAGGGSGATITVSTNAGCTWSAASNDSWLAIASGANGNGSGTVTFAAAANPGGERTGTLSVAGTTVAVTQRSAAAPPPPPASCSFNVGPTTVSATQLGGPSQTTVTTAAGCNWTAASNDSWIGVASGNSGNGSGAVTFNVAVNLGGARTGTLTVAGTTITVNQAALVSLPTCTYNVSPLQQAIGASGGSGATVSVTTASGCTWSAGSGASWITVTSGASGNGSGNVGFTVDANNGSARAGSLTIAGQTVTVNQSGAPAACSFSVSPSSQSVGPLGGGGSFTVTTTSGCSWGASTQTPWISITSGAAGSGGGSVSFTVGINLLGQRSGTITIAGQTVTVTQSGVL